MLYAVVCCMLYANTQCPETYINTPTLKGPSNGKMASPAIHLITSFLRYVQDKQQWTEQVNLREILWAGSLELTSKTSRKKEENWLKMIVNFFSVFEPTSGLFDWSLN